MLAPKISMFASLLALAASQCSMPAGPMTSNGYKWPGEPYIQTTLPDGKVQIECPAGPYLQYGNLGAGGPLVSLIIPHKFVCDPAVGKFFFHDYPVELTLTTLSCYYGSLSPHGLEYCNFWIDGYAHTMVDKPQTIDPTKVCPAGSGYIVRTPTETLMTSKLSCEVGGANRMYATYSNGTKAHLTFEPSFTCETPTTTSTTLTTRTQSTTTRRPSTTSTASTTTTTKPTTTTTRATTTTKKPDSPASAGQLWSVNYYYNYGVGVHAFCADQTCINAIQSNGIGYDIVNGKGLLGRAVSESMINSVRASCPTGSANLRNLGFTKSGNKYLHNFSGTGLKCGWVAISNGACGARVQIKRWKSRYTDDMMYGVDLEWNTWYQGMVQDGGKVHFYMWD